MLTYVQHSLTLPEEQQVYNQCQQAKDEVADEVRGNRNHCE